MSEPYFESGDVTLFHGDALEVARTMPSGSVQTIVTSPPYFGLRDYGEDGQIGAEGSVGEYVARLVELFRELRRVLADDGTLWLNIGDSYGAGKQLMGAPWQVALALQSDGWILRSDIIWAKTNPMPESVTDRPTKAHEYLFLLSKRPSYYYDADAVREDYSDRVQERQQYAGRDVQVNAWSADSGRNDSNPTRGILGFGHRGANPEGRNMRSVWQVPTVPFPGAHFAVYPPELIRPCIRAGSRPGDTVLDPFSGSGTTGAVATFEGRKYIGIDLNREYLDLSLRTRFAQPTLAWEAQ